MDYSKLNEWLNLENVVIVHHMDVDGSCSAAQMLKFIKADTYALKDPHLYDDFLNFLERKKPNVIFFLDLSIDQEWKGLVDLKSKMKKTNFCIIDHHMITKDMNKYGYLHFNPRFEKTDSYIPASLLVFNILKDLGFENEKDRWISAIGTISDFGHKANPGFIKECKKAYPDLLKGKNVFESKLGDASKTIYSAIICKGIVGLKHLLSVLKKSEKFEDFEKDESLKEWRRTVDEEIKITLEDFKKNKQVDGKIIFYEIKNVYGITSIVSNYITEMFPKSVIVIGKKDSEGWKLSIRSPKLKVNLAEVVPRCVEDIGRGGGHEKAAGGFVTDIDLFRKRLGIEINKNLN